MKNFKKNLISISDALSALAVKVEKIVEVFEKESVQAKPAKKKAAKKKAVSKATKKKAFAKKKADSKKSEPTAAASGQTNGNILDNVYGSISSGSEGTTVSELKEKTGFALRQINNALYKLKQSGKIESPSRGVYVKKES